MTADLAAKTILVTGAAAGIGAAAARHFRDLGANVVCADIKPDSGQELAGPQVLSQTLDITSDAAWSAAFQAGIARFGAVHGLFNCAGLVDLIDDIDTVELPFWERAIEVNLTGSYLGCRHALKFMKETGGAIVNVASIYSSVGGTGSLSYAAAKGGVLMLTQSIAKYCLARGYPIRCNDIQPGYIDTPAVIASLATLGGREGIEALHPLHRFGTPDEVARLAAFLLSDDAGYINGAHYPLDGGYLAA